MPELPHFPYHPDPIATGAIAPSPETCPACEQARGYAYATTPFAVDDHHHICPWCIADGSAYAKLDATFVDAWALEKDGMSPKLVAQIEQRTPGYLSWQSHEWLTCCGDACAYHGEVPTNELKALDLDNLPSDAITPELLLDDLREIVKHYEPGLSPAFYKFVCRSCARVRYGWDCD